MKYPIRVLMIFTIMNRGGAENMVMNYYRSIDRSKIQFDFIVHRLEKGAYDDEIKSLGGHIYNFMPLYPLTFNQYKKQISIFFDEHPFYKIIHGHCSESGYFIYKEAYKRGIPVIIAHAHNSHALFDLKWPFRTYFKHAMRHYINNEFSCGKESSLWLFGKNISNQAIIQPNAINTKKYRYNISLRKRVRDKLGLNDESLLIGHVGRFNKQKNHKFLVKIFSDIVKSNDNAYLALVGCGSLMDNVKKQVKKLGLINKVFFLGSRDDIPELLDAMDIFIFPSLMEGLSLSMVEAQCSGLPCVVSENIPKEVSMTDLISFVSLKENANKWANIALARSLSDYDRTIYCDKIKDSGYDIEKNAVWLTNKYFELLSING